MLFYLVIVELKFHLFPSGYMFAYATLSSMRRCIYVNLLDPIQHSELFNMTTSKFLIPSMMSVISSITAPRDREVPSPDSYCNRLLLITITKGDGTPMDASSISEEDIIEICF